MRSALTKLDGIESSDVEIDYDAKTASVTVSDSDLTPTDLVDALKGTGFGATVN